jgi:hypothetical protein
MRCCWCGSGFPAGALYLDLDVAAGFQVDGEIELAAVPTRMKRLPSWNSPD